MLKLSGASGASGGPKGKKRQKKVPGKGGELSDIMEGEPVHAPDRRRSEDVWAVPWLASSCGRPRRTTCHTVCDIELEMGLQRKLRAASHGSPQVPSQVPSQVPFQVPSSEFLVPFQVPFRVPSSEFRLLLLKVFRAPSAPALRGRVSARVSPERAWPGGAAGGSPPSTGRAPTCGPSAAVGCRARQTPELRGRGRSRPRGYSQAPAPPEAKPLGPDLEANP